MLFDKEDLDIVDNIAIHSRTRSDGGLWYAVHLTKDRKYKFIHRLIYQKHHPDLLDT